MTETELKEEGSFYGKNIHIGQQTLHKLFHYVGECIDETRTTITLLDFRSGKIMQFPKKEITIKEQ